MTYDSFRTGLTFGAIVEELWAEKAASYEATGQYNGRVTRGQVLRRWRSHKERMWAYYLEVSEEDLAA